MVTAYYIMKLKDYNKRKPAIADYYSAPVGHRLKKDQETCRICLRSGNISIFNENTELIKAVVLFGGIEVSENDKHPKNLCEVCHKFLKDATLFRNTAQKSDELLSQSTKEEDEEKELDLFVDDNELSQNSDDGVQSTTKWTNNEHVDYVKVKKKEKLKTTCKICNKVMNRSYFKEHMSVHDPNHSKYICEVCGKSFRLRCSYFNHKNRHRSDFPYKCQFCPYRGKYPELFKSHMRIHTGDYRYMCTECPARFLYKSNLNSHVRKHKEPEFKCDSCKRAFHSKLMLDRHFEADHLGIKNHVCSICGKAFGYRNAMMKHQRHMHKREKCQFRRVPAYFLEDQRKEQTNV